jgi:hypothetical protein
VQLLLMMMMMTSSMLVGLQEMPLVAAMTGSEHIRTAHRHQLCTDVTKCTTYAITRW